MGADYEPICQRCETVTKYALALLLPQSMQVAKLTVQQLELERLSNLG